MLFKKSMFQKPKNELEGRATIRITRRPRVPDELWTRCPGCMAEFASDDLQEKLDVCPKCGYHFKMHARARIRSLVDEGSFCEWDATLVSDNVIRFPGYEAKLEAAKQASGERESVITGACSIGGQPCALFVMNPFFMMGSMGRITGEKITRLFERAGEQSLPVVGFTVSGGARIQEGIYSLMQMAKTSGAVGRHSDGGNLYIAVLTNPTTGGVDASFAMEADIILAEPGALIGFAGPRVIEQTIRQTLPPGFQRAEFLLKKGFIDAIVDRRERRATIAKLLAFHAERSGHDGI